MRRYDLEIINKFNHFSLCNAQDESVVWEAVLRWIDHKPDERVKDLTKLMHNVRLGLLMNSVRNLM